tara:strand:+ start:911 stop:1513 length:603 start_codon:yes stop_codon:yes gene_type:complete
MQDGDSCHPFVRALAIWSGALAGLMILLVGSLTPSSLMVPSLEFPPPIVSLPSTWQVPSLFLAALVCGPKAAVMASIAYLTVGLFHLPIFHGGGSLNYLSNPSFGYLISFIPAAWISGRLAEKKNMNNLISLTFCSIVGVIVLQTFGSLYLIIGSSFGYWSDPLPKLLFSYSLAPLLTQATLCPAVAIVALVLRKVLLIA